MRAPKQGYRQQRGDIGLRTAVHKILRLERLISARGRPIPPSSTRGSHRHRRRLGDPRSSAPTSESSDGDGSGSSGSDSDDVGPEDENEVGFGLADENADRLKPRKLASSSDEGGRKRRV